MDVIEAKQKVRAEIERLTPTLLEVSHEIHAHPELNFDEHFAHEILTGVLTDEGLRNRLLERQRATLDTLDPQRLVDELMRNLRQAGLID